MQTRAQSVLEVVTNTFVGMLGSWLITWVCMATIKNRTACVSATVLGCTIWSLARGYVIRRRFARLNP